MHTITRIITIAATIINRIKTSHPLPQTELKMSLSTTMDSIKYQDFGPKGNNIYIIMFYNLCFKL